MPRNNSYHKLSYIIKQRRSHLGKKNGMYGKSIPKKRLEKIKIGREKFYNSEQYKIFLANRNEKVSLALKKYWTDSRKIKFSKFMKNKWKNDKSFIKKIQKRHRISSMEKRVLKVIQNNRLPYVYVGNFKFRVGSKYPDFRHLNKKILIEVYSTTTGFREILNYANERLQYFKKFGYKTIFLTEDIIFSKNWKKDILIKIKKNS